MLTKILRILEGRNNQEGYIRGTNKEIYNIYKEPKIDNVVVSTR